MANKTFIALGVTLAAISGIAIATANANQGSDYKPAQAVASDAQTVSTGSFSGRSDHVTSGKVTLEKTATGYRLTLANDFFLDGAPDPIVALGNGETYLAANKIGTLKNKTGQQSYDLPATFTPGQFSQVYVWCEKFDVPLGVATLSES
ncbi:DM13 domain-containing protein [Litorimonas sp. WD9-15]|uniref:DM13 domain-containing protein n=1 Tax=Litorimonas sp. WD9-15 TaxID=3418716 RepID=UPI003D057DEA